MALTSCASERPATSDNWQPLEVLDPAKTKPADTSARPVDTTVKAATETPSIESSSNELSSSEGAKSEDAHEANTNTPNSGEDADKIGTEEAEADAIASRPRKQPASVLVTTDRFSVKLPYTWRSVASDSGALATFEPRNEDVKSAIEIYHYGAVFGREALEAYANQLTQAIGPQATPAAPLTIEGRSLLAFAVSSEHSPNRNQVYWLMPTSEGLFTIVITTRDSLQERDEGVAKGLVEEMVIEPAADLTEAMLARLPVKINKPDGWTIIDIGASVAFVPQLDDTEDVDPVIPTITTTWVNSPKQSQQERRAFLADLRTTVLSDETWNESDASGEWSDSPEGIHAAGFSVKGSKKRADAQIAPQLSFHYAVIFGPEQTFTLCFSGRTTQMGASREDVWSDLLNAFSASLGAERDLKR